MRIRLTIECDLKEAAMVEEVLAGTAAVICITDCGPPSTPPPRRRSSSKAAAPGKTVGTMKVEDAVVAVLKEQPVPVRIELLEQLVRQKASANYGKGTVPSAANRLARAKRIMRTGVATFARI